MVTNLRPNARVIMTPAAALQPNIRRRRRAMAAAELELAGSGLVAARLVQTGSRQDSIYPQFLLSPPAHVLHPPTTNPTDLEKAIEYGEKAGYGKNYPASSPNVHGLASQAGDSAETLSSNVICATPKNASDDVATEGGPCRTKACKTSRGLRRNIFL